MMMLIIAGDLCEYQALPVIMNNTFLCFEKIFSLTSRADENISGQSFQQITFVGLHSMHHITRVIDSCFI